MRVVLGAQEWLRREAGAERYRPRGVRVGEVRVCVFMRSWGGGGEFVRNGRGDGGGWRG